MSSFHTVAKVGGITPGSMQTVECAGRKVVLANVGGTYFAFDNKCTCIAHFAGHVDQETSDGHRHVGDLGHLAEGDLTADQVTCPMHRTVFDVRTGLPLNGPGEIPVNTYEVRLDRDDIQVAVMSDAERHFWNDPGTKERP